jgi:RNA polymerase sigma factor (TIGR02999 family)
MAAVTQVLFQIEQGNTSATRQLLPLVYDGLRKLTAVKRARERPGQTRQTTALMHEAYQRLVAPDADARFDGRGHFFAAAAEAMRRLLVERARRHKSQRRGGAGVRVELSGQMPITVGTPDQIVAVDLALEQLAKEEPEGMDLVKLVLVSGFSVEYAGRLFDMSRATAYRPWSYPRAWLKNQMARQDDSVL